MKPEVFFEKTRDRRGPKAAGILGRLTERTGMRASEGPSLGRLDDQVVPGSPPELFDYQEELASKVLQATARSSARLMVSLPTGGGKTRTAAVIVREVLLRSGGMVAWVAPSTELLDQGTEALSESWRRAGVGELRITRDPEKATGDNCVLLVTAQWLGRRSRQQLALLQKPAFIVFDEAHQALAPTYLEGIEGWAESPHGASASVLGLSATPGRSEAGGTDLLAALFERRLVYSEILGKDPVDALKARGVLAELHYRLADEVVGADSNIRQREVWDDQRFWCTVDAVCAVAGSDTKGLAFSEGLEHADALAAALIACGVRSYVLSSRMPERERVRTLEWFRNGTVRVLVNKEILTTGFDLPALGFVALTTRIGSAIKYEQIIGRAVRGPAVGGSAAATVLQVEDHRAIHGEPESLARYWDSLWRPE